MGLVTFKSKLLENFAYHRMGVTIRQQFKSQGSVSETNERSADNDRVGEVEGAMGKEGPSRHEHGATITRMGSLSGSTFWVAKMQGSNSWLSTDIFGRR